MTIDENVDSPSKILQKYSVSSPPTIYPQASGVPARSRVYINPYPVGGPNSMHGFDYDYNYNNVDEDEDLLAPAAPIDEDLKNHGNMRRLNSSTSGLFSDEQEGDEHEELNELEQYELEDRLGEMMPFSFGRRNRRVVIFLKILRFWEIIKKVFQTRINLISLNLLYFIIKKFFFKFYIKYFIGRSVWGFNGRFN